MRVEAHVTKPGLGSQCSKEHKIGAYFEVDDKLQATVSYLPLCRGDTG